jgi:hypothetical protein
MNRLVVRLSLASLSLAAVALGACVTPIGNYCSEKASCEDLAPQQEEICNINNQEDADIAGVWGCSSEFDARMACVVDNMQCKNRGTPEADLDIRKDACNVEALILENCIQKAAEDVVECAPGCMLSMTGNGLCESACNTILCGYDDGDCSSGSSGSDCSPGCPQSYLGDGTCDPYCNIVHCSFDYGDCN